MFINGTFVSRLAWAVVATAALHAMPEPAAAAPASTTCRSGAAAAKGGQAGYENDRQKADEVERRDRETSDILGRCVGAVTGVLTIPTFPTLDEILKRIKDQICYIASSQVHEVLGSVTGQIDEAIRHIPGRDGSVSVPVPITPPAVNAATAPSSATPSGISDYLQKIWR